MTGIALKDLDRAVEHGIELKDSLVGTFATSFSHPTILYRVDKDHCDCLGFHYRGHCKHHAAFMADEFVEALVYFAR